MMLMVFNVSRQNYRSETSVKCRRMTVENSEQCVFNFYSLKMELLQKVYIISFKFEFLYISMNLSYVAICYALIA